MIRKPTNRITEDQNNISNLSRENIIKIIGDMIGDVVSPSIEMLRHSIISDQNDKVCTIYYDNHGIIHEIHTEPFENQSAVVEKHSELVCETDEKGNLVQSEITRASARKEGKRYLLVTTLLFHNNEVLLQKRSSKKEIDKGKLSSSAHGVAKSLFFQDGNRMKNIEYLSVINSALEINEELRHGKETKPFNIKIWYGSENKLKERATKNEIDDTNTIYLVPNGFYEDDGYSLGDKKNKRTRAISMGFVFSKEKPHIFIDPAEVESVNRGKPSTFVDNPMITDDLHICIESCFNNFIKTSIRDGNLAKHFLRKSL